MPSKLATVDKKPTKITFEASDEGKVPSNASTAHQKVKASSASKGASSKAGEKRKAGVASLWLEEAEAAKVEEKNTGEQVCFGKQSHGE